MIDEFRKPFELFEEKGIGGILLILFFMLISIEPFLGILSIAVGFNAYPDSKIFLTVFVVFSVAYIVFSLFSGITLKKQYSFAVAATKVFLVYRLIYFTPVLIINMNLQIAAVPYDSLSPTYANESASIMTSFIINISYVALFSIGWYIYLVKSKKVQEAFPPKKTGLNINQSGK
jgi:hypothetical protein